MSKDGSPHDSWGEIYHAGSLQATNQLGFGTYPRLTPHPLLAVASLGSWSSDWFGNSDAMMLCRHQLPFYPTRTQNRSFSSRRRRGKMNRVISERIVCSTSSHVLNLVAHMLRLRHLLVMATVVFHPPNLSLNDCSVQGFPAFKLLRTVDMNDKHSILKHSKVARIHTSSK